MSFKNLNVADFKEGFSSTADAVILDVRTAAEFAGGSIEGAINIDIYGPNFAAEVNKLDKNKPYFVYCMSGGRSSSACGFMESNGFENVSNLVGGWMAWSMQ